MKDLSYQVLLIGGAPGAGKTTLGTALAAKLGIAPLCMDDLVMAAIAVTTPEIDPGLHAVAKSSHFDYFTNSSVEQLISDAKLQHEATRPIFEAVVRRRV